MFAVGTESSAAALLQLLLMCDAVTKDPYISVLGRDYGWDLRYRYTVDVAINLK